MPGYPRKKQDPSDKLDYGFNWKSAIDPFLQNSEIITNSTWAAFTTDWVTTPDITLSAQAHNDTTTTLRVSGGVIGTTYRITNHIVTSESREKDETFEIYIEEQ